MKDSELVRHARRELELLGEDESTIEGLVRVVQAFADMGHSGYSSFLALERVKRLLAFKNLTPITDHPDEWAYHSPELSGNSKGLWQNRRDLEAFSEDGGKTYLLTSERNKVPKPLHFSKPHEES
jgi:hypothetical protein